MLLSLALLVSGVGDPSAPWFVRAAPPAKKDRGALDAERLNADIKAVDAIQRAARNAEVHAVGIYLTPAGRFNQDDVTDWPEFAKLLRGEGGPGARVRGLLPKQQRDLLANNAAVRGLDAGRFGGPEAGRLRGSVSFKIGQLLLPRPDLYDAEAFKGVPLDKELKQLLALGDERTPIQTLRMNRALLATAFPKIVRPVPEDYYVARVVVKAGKPVILALASHEACEWRVETEKGGEVVGVILGGSEPQEVVGVKCPVAYRVWTWPDGTSRSSRYDPQGISTCWDLLDKSYMQFEAGVKGVAGKSLATFQGKHTAPKEGFVVKPSAK